MQTRNQNVANQLQDQGVDPNQYVSLADLQTVLSKFLPQNTIADPKNIKGCNCKSEPPFAQKSQFYNQIMNDGNIFNPYLHRRFLPSQYIKMMCYASRGKAEKGFEAALRNNFKFHYSIDYLVKEIKKLAFLQRSDSVAFSERSKFFNLKVAKEIILDYTTSAISHVQGVKVVGKRKNPRKIIKGRGVVRVGREVDLLIQELEVFNRQVDACNDYKTMSKVLEAFRYVILPNDTKKSKAFTEAYKGSGAYYTLKHLIMFEDYKFKGIVQPSLAVSTLKQYLDQKTPAYVFHAMLKEMLKDNRPF